MTIRKLHTIAGLLLLIPFLAWIVTAMVFYVKPGYADAYEMLQPKAYPSAEPLAVASDTSWREARYLRTILGGHLLVFARGAWSHLDPATLLPRPAPSEEEVRKLVADAISARPDRYGAVDSVFGASVRTTTGVLVTLDWQRLSLAQRGPDTDRIDLLYRIHYLQWTGIPALDDILGPLGLALVFALSMLGLRLALSRKGRTGSAA